MKKFFIKYRYEIIGAVVCVIAGMASGLAGKESYTTWYTTLLKPSFTPPSWIFGPVWTILYSMIGIVGGKLLQDFSHNKNSFYLFILQLFCNLIWSPLFFYYHRIDIALYDIIALWLFILLFMISIKKRQQMLLFITPYFAWVTFAAILNLNLYKLNS